MTWTSRPSSLVFAGNDITRPWVRQLLRRWGIVTRDMLINEAAAPPWVRLVPEFKRLELVGEVQRGFFIEGHRGEQYGLPEAIEMLRDCRARREEGAALEVLKGEPFFSIAEKTALCLYSAETPKRIKPSEGSRTSAIIRPSDGSEKDVKVTPEEAILFIEAQGVVLESGKGSVPNLADAAAGEFIRGSYWGHPKGNEIFLLTRTIRASKDILVCRLVEGKVTYVHKRLWAAIIRLSANFEKEDLGAICEIHSSSGKHEVRVSPFPEWVPAGVKEEAERLTESQATSRLSAWFQ